MAEWTSIAALLAWAIFFLPADAGLRLRRPAPRPLPLPVADMPRATTPARRRRCE